jgi:uncharacterized membrane protein
MTPRTNAKPSAKVPESPAPSTGNPYSPSVPISLYREVATELQSVKTNVESLRLQNQELTQQNQQLRVEIERVVQSALQLRQVADAHHAGHLATSDTLQPDLEVYFEAPPAPVPQPAAPKTGKSEQPEPPGSQQPSQKPFFTEQPSLPRRKPDSPRSSDVGGWWLVLAIVVIVVTAFGTGFLIVRPLLPSR